MKNLLVAIDFSKITEAVIDPSATLAKALNAKLWILHVTSDETQAVVYESTQFSGYSPEFVSMPGDIQLARDLSAEEIKREHNELLGISAKLREQGIDSQALLIKGAAAKTIVAKADELDAGMIIIGSHGHGLLHKALLGSVSEAVMKQANRCVLVVPSPEN
jgi:nucleotide-binding universal stress UspA family protein